MTTRVPIRYGGTGANTAADARTALGVPPLAAYDTANSAYDQANAAYAQANAAYDAANNAQVTVYANNASNVTTQNVNFVNTATVTVTVTADGSNANIEFTAAPQTVVNDTYTAAGNTAAAATANIANGLYAISTNAYDQANSARDQANTAYGQANDAYAQANTAYGQANDAYAAANTANTNALNAYAQANAAYDQANTAYGQANSAYAQANVAYGQANDAYAAANTANTNALAAYGQANLAYTQANAAYNQANAAYAEANLKLNLTGGTIGGDLAVSGNLTVSGNTYYVNVSTYQVDDPLIYLAANNDTSDVVDIGFMGGHNTSGVYQHSGLIRHAADGNWYLFTGLAEEGHENNVVDIANTTLATLKANINANSLLLVGNAVATQANLTISHNQANTAYGQANNAYAQANDAYSAANNAANTVRVSQNGASTLSAKQLNFVNTGNIVIAVTDAGDGNANIEFELTTGGGTLSNIAISSNGTFATNANAFNFINTATVSVTVESGVDGNANISFTSLGGGGNTSIAHQSFTGDGNTTIFTLSSQPEDIDHTLVFVDLVYQPQTAYSLNGNDLEFDTAPDNGASIDVYVYGAGGTDVSVASDTFTGTGSCTSFTLSQSGVTNRTLVYLDGVSQRPVVDYQVSGTGLTFNVAPANASVIEARTFSNFRATDINVAPVSLTSDTFTGTGACTVFNLSQSSTTDGTFVFINGVAQKPGSNYTVANDVLTMASAPSNGSVVEARTIGQFKVVETSSKIESDVFNGDGNTTVFLVSASSTTKKAFVYIDGVAQKPYTDYVLTGNRLSFVEAPPDGVKVEVRTFSPFVVAQEALKTLNIYARTGAVAIALTGAGTFTVVGRSANTSIGVS